VQSYHHREIYTICYLLAIAWPAFYGMDFVRENSLLVATWSLSCASMSLFTLLPANKVENTSLMYVFLLPGMNGLLLNPTNSLIGGLLMLAVGGLYLLFEDSVIKQLPATRREESREGRPLISRAVIGTQVSIVPHSRGIGTDKHSGWTHPSRNASNPVQYRLNSVKTRSTLRHADGRMANNE
jgi:phosphatidylinositol glycan class N